MEDSRSRVATSNPMAQIYAQVSSLRLFRYRLKLLTMEPRMATSSPPAFFKKTILAINLVATENTAKTVKTILVAIITGPRDDMLTAGGHENSPGQHLGSPCITLK